MNQEIETGATMATKAAPPIGVVGANIAGVPVADWVQYATLVYVLMMGAHFAWKWYREIKAAKKEDESAN